MTTSLISSNPQLLLPEPTDLEIADFAAALNPAIEACKQSRTGLRFCAYWDEDGKASHVLVKTVRFGRITSSLNKEADQAAEALQLFADRMARPLPKEVICNIDTLAEQLLRAIRMEHPRLYSLAFQAEFQLTSRYSIFKCWIEERTKYLSGGHWEHTNLALARHYDATEAVADALYQATSKLQAHDAAGKSA